MASTSVPTAVAFLASPTAFSASGTRPKTQSLVSSALPFSTSKTESALPPALFPTTSQSAHCASSASATVSPVPVFLPVPAFFARTARVSYQVSAMRHVPQATSNCKSVQPNPHVSYALLSAPAASVALV